MSAQKFSFLPEVGFLLGQIDGDKLQGFHKKGYLFGVGTNYALGSEAALAIHTRFYKHGSARKDIFQEKLLEGSQITMDINTIGLELSFLYRPQFRRIFLGTGLVFHQILNYDYKLIDNVITGPERILDPNSVKNSFLSFTAYLGVRFDNHLRTKITFERGISNVLTGDFLNLSRIYPYAVILSLGYEFNSIFDASNKKKKVRRLRR